MLHTHFSRGQLIDDKLLRNGYEKGGVSKAFIHLEFLQL